MDIARAWLIKTVTERAPAESSYGDVKAMDKELVDVMLTVPAIVEGKISYDPLFTMGNGVCGKAYIEACWNAFIRKYIRTQVDKDFHFGVPRKYEQKIKNDIRAVVDYLKASGFCLVAIEEEKNDGSQSKNKKAWDKMRSEILKEAKYTAYVFIGRLKGAKTDVSVMGPEQELLKTLAAVMVGDPEFKKLVSNAMELADLTLTEAMANC